jgi:threonine synthase
MVRAVSALLGFRCSSCGRELAPSNTPTYACDRCDGAALDVVVDLKGAKVVDVDRSLWRYAQLLPVGVPNDASGPLREVGGTPLHPAARSGHDFTLWIKDDGRLPTGSLKDRASAVVAMRARDLGLTRLVVASTGNAGVATAAMARAAGLEPVVLVPETAPRAKIAQLLVFGAELYLVRGRYDDAFALAREASQALGWYCRNTALNPFTAEGKKTVSFEICEELATKKAGARFLAPDRIYVPVGDGNIIAGVHKGLRELHELGWIDRLPRLYGVQAEGSAAIAQAFRAGTEEVLPVVARTIADSIACDQPADGVRALRAVRETGGEYLTVSDEAILLAIAALGRDATVFAEPAAAAAYAGMLAHAGSIGAGEQVVVLITGNGLKDVAAAERAVAAARVIDPTLAALERAMKEPKP